MAEIPVGLRLDIVRMRREELLARCTYQRAVIAGCCRELQQPARIVDRILAAAAYLRAHPLLLVVFGGAFAAVRPRNFSKWAGRGMMLWQMLRGLSSFKHILRR